MDMLLLKSKLMKGILAKLIEKEASKRLGYKVQIEIDSLEVQINDDQAAFHIDVKGGMAKDDFSNLLKKII